MRKNRILFSFFTTLSCSVLLAQVNVNGKDFIIAEKTEIEIHKKSPEKLMGIDFHYWGTSFLYTGKIRENLFFGFEVGLLPDKFEWVILAGEHFTEENTIWSNDRSDANLHKLRQFLFGHVLVRWQPSIGWFEIDGGFRVAAYVRNIPYEDDKGIPAFYGVYLKPAIGFYKFKIGIRLGVGGMFESQNEVKEFVAISSPYLRINLN